MNLKLSWRPRRRRGVVQICYEAFDALAAAHGFPSDFRRRRWPLVWRA